MARKFTGRKPVKGTITGMYENGLVEERILKLENEILEEFSKRLTEKYGEKYEVKSLLDLDYGRQRLARKLYEHLFPIKDEREPWRKILYRLERMANRSLDELLNKGRPHVVVILNERRVVGYSQFLTLPMGEKDVVVYAEYGGLADEKFMRRNYSGRESFRGRGLYRHMFELRHAVASAEAKKRGGVVVGTIGDVEMLGQGETPEEIKLSGNRLAAFLKVGFGVVVGYKGDQPIAFLMQPRLDEDSEPMLLQLVFAPSGEVEITEELLKKLPMVYIECFYDETFNKADVDYARTFAEGRINEVERITLVRSLDEIPTIYEFAKGDKFLKGQIERQYGRSTEEQKKLIESVFAKQGRNNEKG